MSFVNRIKRWPKTVPILEAEHICRGTYTVGERHCLWGWAAAVFNSDKEFCMPEKPLAAIREAIAELVPVTKIPSNEETIVGTNDNRAVSRQLIARIWNLAMAKLGYVVGNPEAAKRKGRGK